MVNNCVVLVAFVVASLWNVCSGQSLLQAIVYDQAPATMHHALYSVDYWKYGTWTDNPTIGNCGTANGTKGFTNSDFEIPLYWYGTVRTPNPSTGVLYNGEPGLAGPVCNKSNSFKNCASSDFDGNPIYAYNGPSPLGSIRSATTFKDFYTQTDQNFPVKINLTLTNLGGRKFSFSEKYFFPVDGKGWQDSNLGEDGRMHNFGFCMVIHNHFTYIGGETFSFTGDDDVFVFMDRKLVIDLGGIHTALSASINVDDIPGLIIGNFYKFDFIYCERHTVASDILFETTIDFKCSYYDRCDVCEGDGQSCCTTADLAVCDDHNACTQDLCDIVEPPTKTCQHIPINCNDKSMCSNEYCDPIVGCVYSKVSCSDGNACTDDACLNATGCSFTTKNCPGDKCNIPLCDKTNGCSTQTVDCNDKNACTDDACDPAHGCSNTPKNCDDSNACTIDTCDKTSGCQNLPRTCDDGSLCTSNTCDIKTGCQFIPIPCDDGTACTTDTCDPKIGCQNTKLLCNDSSVCTADSCDPKLGCQFKPLPCTDSNACTTDVCDAVLGCTHPKINGCTRANCTNTPTTGYCTPCGPTLDCTYTDPCNPMTCVNNQCTVSPVVCNDNNKCSTDTCVNSNGVATCSFVAAPCITTDVCNPKSCNSTIGVCSSKAVSCDDGNNCTTDSCTSSGGKAVCVNTLISCPFTDLCNPQSCDPTNGSCTTKLVNCDDANVCTVDTCTYKAGDSVATCAHNSACTNFTTIDACTPVVCNNTVGCANGVQICNDNNPCTTDSCIGPMQCNYTLTGCDDNDACTSDFCDPQAATASSMCSHKPVNCTAPSLCYTVLPCNKTSGCTFAPITCPAPASYCQMAVCDDTVGCINIDKPCIVDDADCYIGVCDNATRSCSTSPRDDFATITTSKHGGVTCFAFYNADKIAIGLGAGAIAGIVIAAVIFAVLAALAGRQAYLYLSVRQGAMGGTNVSPLYQPSGASGENVMYRN